MLVENPNKNSDAKSWKERFTALALTKNQQNCAIVKIFTCVPREKKKIVIKRITWSIAFHISCTIRKNCIKMKRICEARWSIACLMKHIAVAFF